MKRNYEFYELNRSFNPNLAAKAADFYEGRRASSPFVKSALLKPKDPQNL